jgi:hypothetical protein
LSPLIETLEKAVPRVAFYPRWARALFATAVASVLVSILLFSFEAPGAEETRFLENIGFDISAATGSKPAYVHEHRGETLTIVPDVPYLSRLDRGGPISIQGRSVGWSNTNYLPILNVNLTNNGKTTLFITQAWLQVERSVPVRRPILVLWPYDTPRRLELENEGWRDLQEVVVDFDILPGGARAVFRPPYRHRLVIGRVHAHRSIDITRQVTREGVDMRTVTRLERKLRDSPSFSPSLTPDEEKALRLALKPFPKEYALAVGQIRYSDAGVLRRVRFFADFGLFERPPPRPPPPPDVDFVAQVQLKAQSTRYERAVQMSGAGEVLEPGQVGRFGLSVSANSSSRHLFRIRMRTNDGHELISPPVDLSIFVPREHEPPEFAPAEGGS